MVHIVKQNFIVAVNPSFESYLTFSVPQIWLKDAMQCRNCGLCCHKKCVTKCQESSPCVPKGQGEFVDTFCAIYFVNSSLLQCCKFIILFKAHEQWLFKLYKSVLTLYKMYR